MEALLPCPFCGGSAEILQIGNEATPKRGFEVKCETWGCRTTKRAMVIRQPLEKAKAFATNTWNTRASDRTGSEAYTAEGKDARDELSLALDALRLAREYVADALDAYEHSDGRELLNRIAALLSPPTQNGADHEQ